MVVGGVIYPGIFHHFTFLYLILTQLSYFCHVSRIRSNQDIGKILRENSWLKLWQWAMTGLIVASMAKSGADAIEASVITK